jgi:hypothetical protein
MAAVPVTAIEANEIGDAIIVTGSRMRRANFESASPITVVTAQLETLGDLKLYRIPVPVTVAANAQKQVALLHMDRVRFDRLYAASVQADDEDEDLSQASILLRTKNIEAKGMGRPLPSGSVAVFEQAEGMPMLVGEAPIRDTPVGQDVEIMVGESPDVSVSRKALTDPKRDGKGDDKRPVRHEVVVSNARPVAIDLELRLNLYEEDYRLAKVSRKLGRKNGAPLWRAHVPANGTARLTYEVERKPPRPEADD